MYRGHRYGIINHISVIGAQSCTKILIDHREDSALVKNVGN